MKKIDRIRKRVSILPTSPRSRSVRCRLEAGRPWSGNAKWKCLPSPQRHLSSLALRASPSVCASLGLPPSGRTALEMQTLKFLAE